MTPRGCVALAHGGAEADPSFADGPARAAEAAVAVMRGGGSALDAVIEAVRLLEDDGRFNAGLGSNLRLDGRTVGMDAALAESGGRFASVIGLDDVRNPILVARDLLATPHPVLAGPGATRFARRMGYPRVDPRTTAARRRLVAFRAAGGAGADVERMLQEYWNYEGVRLPSAETTGPRAERSGDTVGAVAHDGATFAAAGSTGGLMAVLDGRVSDIALPGCGVDASAHGAVCVSGAGDRIVRARVASRVLRLMEDGARASDAAERAMDLIPPGFALAVLVLDAQGGTAARGRVAFPWGAAGGR